MLYYNTAYLLSQSLGERLNKKSSAVSEVTADDLVLCKLIDAVGDGRKAGL